MSNKLLKLYFSREQRSEVVDCLMQVTSISGFSIYDIDGFSRRHEQFDIGEQIRGARHMQVAEIIATEQDIVAIRDAVRALHFGEPLRYLVQPLEAVGHFN
jgi:hypothetical protein